MVRGRAIVALVAGVALVVAGCGTPEQTITGDEAIKRIDSYVADALSAAPPSIHLVRTTAEATYTGGCTKGLSDSDFTGQVEAELEYEATNLPANAGAQYVDAIDRLWKKKWGAVDRARDGVRVQSVDDGQYRLFGLYEPGTGRVTVGGTSSCIWAHGTPGPEDNP